MFGKRSDSSTEHWEVKLSWVQPPLYGCKSSWCIKHSETRTHRQKTRMLDAISSYPGVPISVITILYAEMVWYFIFCLLSLSQANETRRGETKCNSDANLWLLRFYHEGCVRMHSSYKVSWRSLQKKCFFDVVTWEADHLKQKRRVEYLSCN